MTWPYGDMRDPKYNYYLRQQQKADQRGSKEVRNFIEGIPGAWKLLGAVVAYKAAKSVVSARERKRRAL